MQSLLPLHMLYMQIAFARAEELEAKSGYPLQQFSEGITRYCAIETTPHEIQQPVVWQQGSARLFSYSGRGAPLLLIPSLINHAYIFDLTAQYSMARYLANQGFSVYLLDWGNPQAEEAGYTLEDYITQRLLPAAHFIRDQHSLAPTALGYCMGGLIALAALHYQPDVARTLVMVASPWDFQVNEHHRWFQQHYNRDFLKQLFARFDLVPGSLIHSMLYAGDPVSTYAKYARFVELEPDTQEYDLFLAREQWLHDPVPLAPAIARLCMIDWAIDNTPQQQSWRVFGKTVQPNALSCPTLIANAAHDKLIPATSCRSLIATIPNVRSITPQTGHLGLVAGLNAEKECWNPLVNWLLAL